jgi:hypothetical protein
VRQEVAAVPLLQLRQLPVVARHRPAALGHTTPHHANARSVASCVCGQDRGERYATLAVPQRQLSLNASWHSVRA